MQPHTRYTWGAVALTLVAGLLAAAPGAELSPTSIEGPFVANVTDTSAVVWWGGPGALGGRVVIGEWSARVDAAPYEVPVTGLGPTTTYSYYVTLADGSRLPEQGSYEFTTAPRPGGGSEAAFAVMCDSRGTGSDAPVNSSVLRALVSDARARGARFICFPGDMVYGYCATAEPYRDQLRQWKAAVAPVMHEIPFYTTMGNHDVVVHEAQDGQGQYSLDGAQTLDGVVYSEELFSSEFVNPGNGPAEPERPGAPHYDETCFSFDFGNTHVVMLNTNYWSASRCYPCEPGEASRLYEEGNPEGRLMDGQLQWLEEDLRRARAAAAQHIFILGHEPAFPVSSHIGDAMCYWGNATQSLKRDVRGRRDRLWALLSRYGVAAAFFGDEHNYSRSLIAPAGAGEHDPAVWQLVTGGAGATLANEFNAWVPWADAVRVFSARPHYCLVRVKGRQASLEVYALPEGALEQGTQAPTELIDRVADLTVRD